MQAALAPLTAHVKDHSRQLKKLARMTAIVSGTTAFVQRFTLITYALICLSFSTSPIQVVAMSGLRSSTFRILKIQLWPM
jgi:hypothetical protein